MAEGTLGGRRGFFATEPVPFERNILFQTLSATNPKIRNNIRAKTHLDFFSIPGGKGLRRVPTGVPV